MLLDSLRRDLRHALRILTKNPGFAALAILVLALGIGANVAIFTVVESVLLRPLSYSHPERLIVALHQGTLPVSLPDFLDYRKGVTAFEQFGAAQGWGGNLTGRDKPEAIEGLQVTSNMFDLLGTPPALGRNFNQDDETPNGARVLILSDRLWRRLFAADRSILGRTIALDGKPFTIVGVMPPGFQFAPFWITQAEMWTPLDVSNPGRGRGGRSLRTFGRLRPGVSIQQAQAQMDAIALRLAELYPQTNARLGITVVPLQEKVVGQVRPTLLVLFGTVAFVLLIACANLANLMLTRAMGRQKEVAVRLALGAGRTRLFAQLITEGLVIAGLGAAAGFALASWGVKAFSTMLPPGSMPRQNEIGFDALTFLFALAVTLISGIAAGLAPAIRLSGSDLNGSLQEGGRGGTQTGGQRRIQSLLVSAEVALALMLLAGAGLMIRTSLALHSVDAGFRADHLLTFLLSAAGTSEDTPARRELLFKTAADRLAAIPGVESVGAINHLPIGGDLWTLDYEIPGRPKPEPNERPGAAYRVIMPGYFEAAGLPLLQGRALSPLDAAAAPPVAVINETLARHQWPNANPVGEHIIFADDRVRTIVGVVKDARQSDWTSPIRDEIYLPYAQRSNAFGAASLTFLVRTKTDPAGYSILVQQAVSAVNRGIPVSHVSSMDQVIADHLWRSRLATMLLGLFAAIALALAGVGIYGVIAYSVRRRTQEIGIRMALGARPADVIALALREGMAPVLAGAGAGVLLAIASSRLMTKLIYGVGPNDPVTLSGVTVLLLAVALAANLIPAHRAARVDPVTALRGQ